MNKFNSEMEEADSGVSHGPCLFNSDLLNQQLFLETREGLRTWKQDG